MYPLSRESLDSGALVLYQGLKTIRGSQDPLEFCVIDHFRFGVKEILAYDRKNRLESTRIYVKVSKLQTQIKSSLVEYLLSCVRLFKYEPNEQCFELSLNLEEGIPAVLCTKPSGLKAFIFSPAHIE